MNSEHNYLTHAQRAAQADTEGDRQRIGQHVTPATESASERRPGISTWKDTFNLLALAAAYDGRERSRYEAEAWLTIFTGYAFEDVKQAIVEHYRASRFPVMPADVIQIIEEGPTS